MSKKFTKFMAFFMSLLMIITVLPTEYLLSYALEIDDNSLSFVEIGDKEVEVSNDSIMIQAKTYKKEYEIKTQFNYAIDYKTKNSYAPGEMVYVIPSFGFYDNGVTSGYILPTDISVNNTNTEIWNYEITNIGDSRVVKITNKITLTPEVVTDGYMQFATVINPRTMLAGKVTLNPIVILISEDGGNTATKSNQLKWGYTLYKDEFSISEDIKDVQVENASELGKDANTYYWAKYDVNISSEVANLHSLQANNFKVNMFLPNGAILYSVNGNKNVTTTNNTYSTEFNVSEWNYTQIDTPKTLSIIVKYPKSTFDGSEVSNNVSLDVQYIGENSYQEIATASVKHTLHDYDVKYDGDLFAVQTDKNAGYEISWNSLNRGKASPFSFYMSGLSRYNGSYSAIIENDALEILTNDGFYRLTNSEYNFSQIVINDLTHFTNSIGEQYTSLDFAILVNDELFKSGSINNNTQTFVLPENTTSVAVAFYDLNSSLYLDSTAIKVIGAIDLKDSSNVIKEGELRNLVNLLVLDDDGNVLNKVDKTNYIGSDAERLANYDLDKYGMYLQRDIDSLIVTYKASQINVNTQFNPTKSVYNKNTNNQESKLEITSFFAAPGEVNSFSVYDILPKDVTFTGNITYLADADLYLADGTIIAKEDVNTFLNKYAKVNIIDNYKSSGRTYIDITFTFENGKEICFDSTMTNSFTSGKITTILDVTVPNVDATYDNTVAMIFHDEHHETILKTKDDGSASLVNKDEVLWMDIDNDGNVEELVDYANATLTSVYVKADNEPIIPEKTPSIKIEKTSDKEVYNNGETIIYTINVTNNGETDLTNVVITDKLDGEFTLQDGIKINKNIATIEKLEIGKTLTLTYKVAVPTNSKNGDTIKNIVTVTTNEGVSDEDDVTVKIEVPEVKPEKTPSISITKTADKEVYKIGETIVYTINVINNGEIDLTNVVITESLIGTFVEDNNIKINNNIATIDSLKIGESKTLIFKVVVPSTSKDGDIIQNTVTVTTNEKVSDEAKKDIKVIVPVVIKENPSLDIVKTADKATYNPEDTITYTIKVTNDGNIDLNNVKIIETLNGKWKEVSSNINIVDDKNATIKELKVGETETLTFIYVVPSNATDNSSIKNIVKAQEDTYNLNDSDDVTVTILEKENPAIAITKVADKKNVKPGETIIYTITVKNTGNVDLTNVNIVDSLTKGKFSNVDTVTRVNDYTLIIPTLKVGESKSFTFTYKVDENNTSKSITNVVTAIETSHSLRVEDKVSTNIEKPITTTITQIVQTGDNTPIIIFLGLAFISLIGMCVITKISTKRK